MNYKIGHSLVTTETLRRRLKKAHSQKDTGEIKQELRRRVIEGLTGKDLSDFAFMVCLRREADRLGLSFEDVCP